MPKKSRVMSKCKAGYMRNPETNRCIKVGGATYLALKKQGVLGSKKQRVSKGRKKPRVSKGRKKPRVSKGGKDTKAAKALHAAKARSSAAWFHRVSDF